MDRRFGESLGLVSDCHRRVEYLHEVLIAIDADAAGGRLTPAKRDALEGALRYFPLGAFKYTRDEEDDLVPRLRDSSDPRATEAMAVTERLERDYHEADEHHARIDALVRQWLAEDRLTVAHAAELRHRLARVRLLYARHLVLDDQRLTC